MIGFVVVIKPLNITQCVYCKTDKQVSFNTDEIDHKYCSSKPIHSNSLILHLIFLGIYLRSLEYYQDELRL